MELRDVLLQEASFFAPKVDLSEAWLARPVPFMIRIALAELSKARGVHSERGCPQFGPRR